MDFFDREQRPRKVWSQYGKCRELTPEEADNLFWNLPKGRPSKTPPHKTFCLSCPVMLECLNFGIVHDEKGVWGGSTETQREKLPPQLVLDLRAKARAEGWWEGYSRELLEIPQTTQSLPEILLDLIEEPEEVDCPLDHVEPVVPAVVLTPFQQECLELFGWY